MGNKKVCVICMKWGELYGPEYVNRLYRAVQDHLALTHDFICITDNFEGLEPGITCQAFDFSQLDRPLWTHGKWPKLQMFERSIVENYDAALFLDVDLLVTGDLDPLFQLVMDRGGLFLMPKFRGLIWRMIPAAFWDLFPWFMSQVTRGNSSVVGFIPSQQFHLFDEFDGQRHLPEYENDQNYISDLAFKRRCFPKNWCIGLIHLVPYWPLGRVYKPYKKKPKRPKIVIFNGRPNPDELVTDEIGSWGARRRRAYGSVQWVADYLEKYDK
ncbi:MAG: hypothetical protein ACWA49_02155 [Ruegeria sp.]